MFRNYLQVAIRNLWRNKFFSGLNILGLALGMACSMLIFLWILDERGTDAFHAHGDKLFSVYERQYYDKKVEWLNNTPGPMAAELKVKIPEIQYSVAARYDYNCTFKAGEKILKENGGYASEDYFKMFSYPLVEGSIGTALNTPVSIAISRKMATDMYGSPSAAIGKTIRYEDRKDMRVTAVFENLPSRASEKFEWLVNYATFLDENKWARVWGNYGPSTFIKIRNDADPTVVRKKIRHFLDNYPVGQSATYKVELDMQGFADRYLHSVYKDGKVAGGRIQYVHLFSIVAMFILLIACINFMNLTTARSLKRAKEIGVRKVVGALRPMLVGQFIGEAILLTLLAVLIAFFIVITALPAFNQLTGKQIELPYHDLRLWGALALLTLVTGFLAGSYPAMFLSGFNPIRVLKGSIRFGTGTIFIRKGLVVFQFVLSIILIISTIVVSRQIHYIQSRNLGYDRENLVYIPLEGGLAKGFDLFRQQASVLPGVAAISRMGEDPTNIGSSTFGIDWEGRNPHQTVMFTQTSVGYDFEKTMHLQFVAGRDFSPSYPTDSNGYILNETALMRTGYSNPIGKPFTMWGKKGHIIGIVKDFHFGSMHRAIQPLVIQFAATDQQDNIIVRIRAGHTQEALAGLAAVCKQVNPHYPFTYQFSDEEFAKLYKNEQVVSRLAYCFAVLAIFICCLGLLGLALFMAEQRTREMGIRKVLGASVGSLLSLLSREFVILVVIALVIASPLAWLAMSRWLADFAYHTDLTIWIFLAAGGLALLIALVTVGFQSFRAAVANPVNSLRSE